MRTNLKTDQLFVVVLLFIIFLFLCIYLIKRENKEQFNSETKFDDIIGEESMNQRNDMAKKELFVKSVGDSIDRVRQEQGILKFENANTNSALLDKYINNIILDDIGNPNKLLVEGSHYELPTVVEDDFIKYNHELRLMNISKQVKQDYILKVLRHKLSLMLNSLKSVKDIKTDLEELKLPENRHIVKILKKDKEEELND